MLWRKAAPADDRSVRALLEKTQAELAAAREAAGRPSPEVEDELARLRRQVADLEAKLQARAADVPRATVALELERRREASLPPRLNGPAAVAKKVVGYVLAFLFVCIPIRFRHCSSDARPYVVTAPQPPAPESPPPAAPAPVSPPGENFVGIIPTLVGDKTARVRYVESRWSSDALEVTVHLEPGPPIGRTTKLDGLVEVLDANHREVAVLEGKPILAPTTRDYELPVHAALVATAHLPEDQGPYRLRFADGRERELGR